MQLKKQELIRIFNKLDMEVKSTHHKMAYFYHKGKRVLKTRASHGRGDIPKPVVRQIINQFYLTKDQFIDLKECPLTRDDFVAILKEKGYLTN